MEAFQCVNHNQRNHQCHLHRIDDADNATACNSRNSVFIFFSNHVCRILALEAANYAFRLPCHQKSLIHHSSVGSVSLHHFPTLRGSISILLIRQRESQVSPSAPAAATVWFWHYSRWWWQITVNCYFCRHQIRVGLCWSSMWPRSRWCSSGFSWDWNNHGGKIY